MSYLEQSNSQKNRMVVAREWVEGQMGRYSSMGIELQFGKTKFWTGW